jgi:hypothetical protein
MTGSRPNPIISLTSWNAAEIEDLQMSRPEVKILESGSQASVKPFESISYFKYCCTFHAQLSMTADFRVFFSLLKSKSDSPKDDYCNASLVA